MQFLTVSRRRSESFPEADFAALSEAETQQARVLYAQGFIRQIWRRRDVPGVCTVVESDSEEHVREMLNTLPMIKAGMIEVSIIPLTPYTGFGPLKG
jgi:muconolactone delta-isomerase